MLKQVHKKRAIFLKLFTQELLLNSKPKKEKYVEIKSEKEKKSEDIKKLKEPIKTEKKGEKEKLLPSILSSAIKPPAKTTKKRQKEIKKLASPLTPKKKLKRPGLIKPIRKEISPQKMITPMPSFTQTIPTQQPVLIGGLNLGKLGGLLADKSVTEIECPGPGKFILVKKVSQVNITRITLSQDEINNIIEAFSEQARIPIISGIFKAAVGDLTILAVISEFVGSRFIIYKSTPYSILESQTNPILQAQMQARMQSQLPYKKRRISSFLK